MLALDAGARQRTSDTLDAFIAHYNARSSDEPMCRVLLDKIVAWKAPLSSAAGARRAPWLGRRAVFG